MGTDEDGERARERRVTRFVSIAWYGVALLVGFVIATGLAARARTTFAVGELVVLEVASFAVAQGDWTDDYRVDRRRLLRGTLANGVVLVGIVSVSAASSSVNSASATAAKVLIAVLVILLLGCLFGAGRAAGAMPKSTEGWWEAMWESDEVWRSVLPDVAEEFGLVDLAARARSYSGRVFPFTGFLAEMPRKARAQAERRHRAVVTARRKSKA